jgi:leader peptidase (prepilin peptidase)/N-methyltransferase
MLTALRGRCPACRGRVAWPPAAAEVAGGGLFGVLALRVHPPFVLGAACSLAAAGIVLAVVDARTRRLPDRVVVPTLVVVAVLVAMAGVDQHRPAQLATAVVGGAATFGFYALLGLVTGGVGFGDEKLGGVCGLVLGWYGWETALWGSTITFLLAALYVLARLAVGRVARRSQVPLAPFMLAGSLVTLLLVA